MRLSRDIALFGTILGISVGIVALSARATEPVHSASLEQKLQQEVDHLKTSHFERVDGGAVETLGKGEQTIVPVQLEAGTVYAIVAVCGEGCDHVEIALFDPAQTLLHRSPETSDVVIVTGPPQESGVHGIAVSARGCREATCSVGLVLLKQAKESAAANTPETRATPVPPQAAPSPSTSTAGVRSNADAEALRILSELVNLGVTARDALRAKKRASAPIAAPVATDASTAPGRPPGLDKPAALPKPQTTQAPNKGNATQANCQQMARQYEAYARTAGAPGTMPQLFSMYQYLQCNCGYPPSPQLPPCPR